MTVECGGAERRLPEPWEHRGEVHSDVGGQRCSEVMGEKRENSQLGRISTCSGLDVRSSLLGKGGEAVRREGEDLGEINRSQVVRALYAEVGAEAGVGVGLASALGVNVPQTHQTFHIAACLERNGTPLQYSCLENPMDGGAW